MENVASSTTGTKVDPGESQYGSLVSQAYYQPGFNNGTNNMYGVGNMYERPSPQAPGHGEASFPQQAQPYGGTEAPTIVASGANLLTQPHAPQANPSTFSSYSLPAPPPYAPHPNPMFGTLPVDHSGAGSLHLTSEQSLDQYLSTPQTHLLQLRGTNPVSQQPPTNNFPLYGMPERPQRFPAIHNLPFQTDPNLKQSTVVPIHEDDSSSAFREASSHINRKKRKACGRCGPCQRKDNCGTCMNCVNRAKGKQICIYRKCEELKKKPGTETYATSTTPDHQVEPVTVRQEKRKELEQLYSERKRSRTEESTGLVQQGTTLPHQKYPAFTATQHNFGQQPNPSTSFPQQQSYAGVPHSSSSPFQQQILQNSSPHSYPLTQNSAHIPGSSGEQAQTTDIISEALREIEHTTATENVGDLASVLNQGSNSARSNKEVSNPNYNPNQQSNYQQWNVQQSVEGVQQQQTPSLLQAQLQGEIRLPGQPPPLPPGPGPGSQSLHTGINHYQTSAPAGTQALPDQLLSNLTRFNEFGSFQRSAPSLIQSGNGKQPISVSCANYEATPINSQSTEQKFQAASTIDDNQLLSVIVPTVSTATQQAPFGHILVTSDSGNMYRNTSTLAYSMSYANEGSVQTMDPKVTNPLAPQLHRPYNHLGQPNLHGAPTQNFRAMFPQMTNMRYAASPAMHPPHPHYAGQNTRMPVHRFQTNVAQQSPDPSYAASAMEQKHRNLNQATSNNAMSGYPSQPPDYVKKEQKEFGQGYFNQQYQPKQWDNPMMGNQNPIGSVSSIANQGLVKQEIISPKASHSALHSPVSSTHQETGDHSSTISHMPELAPSPIPHASGLDLNSVKAEEKGDILNQQVFNNNDSEGKIQSVEQAQEVTSAAQNFNMHSAPLMGHHSGGAVGFQYAQPHGSSPGQPVFTVNQTNHVNGVFQPHIAKQNNINNGAAIHAAMHPQSTPLENTSMITSATSNSNISCWQPMQHSEPSTNIASVASQSDTNLTISPGESGYDSAEIVQEAHTKQHQIGTSQSSSHNHVSSVPSSLETKESPKGGSHLKTSASSSNQDSIGPKNLYRAPVGAKAGTLNNPAAYQLSYKNNDLPSAGACALKHKQFSRFLTNSNDAANFNIKGTPTSMSKRSLSCDDAIYSTRSSYKEEEKNVVRLRRFSNQESSGTAQKEFVSTHLLQLSKRELDEEKLKRHYHSFPNDFAEHVKQDEVWKYNIPKPDMKLLSMSKNHDAVYPQRRLVPFDTPPVTPCSADFSVRQTSVDNTIESNLGVNKISDILPTPPHTSDTPMGKFTANGFASPASETSSDFKPQSMQHDLQPNTQFEAEPTSHRGCRVQTETGSPSKTEFAKCNCIEGTDGRNDEAPYYTHLGAAESISGIRRLFEKRTGYTGNAIRIEKVIYTGKEGKTSTGCPMAKWIIRRSSEEEKILVVCRQRPGHRCPTAVITVIILLWDGVTRPLADFAYTNFTDLVPKHGEPTERRCATNDERTCACQGFNEETCGASFSFGCSWSMYYNGCKFARSNQPNKYKLNGTKDPDAEKFIGKLCERLATVMSPLYQMAAPDAFQNQVEFEEDSSECRLGEARGPKTRPFSGVTSCIDFSAHAHKDQHNIDNGSTVVVTFTKPELRQVGIKPEDEQLHVLPLCKLDFSNEDGSCEGVAEKISSGAIEILDRWRHEVRTRKEPKLSKKQKTRAVKKKNGPGFDSTDSPPYKRRGRPPKQDRAMENTLNEQNNHFSVNNNMMTSKMTDFTPGSPMFQSPPRPQLLVPGPQAHQTTSPHVHPQFSNPCSPTRWPYRRQAPPTPHSANPFSPPPISSPRFEAKQAQTPTGGKDDNLPSIGDFFHPGQAPNDPTDNTQQVTSAECHPATPLPSINDVVGHPFHQNFSSVQGGFHVRNITPGTPAHNPNMPPSTPHYQDAAIHLKAYAAHAGPNQTCMENFENLPQPTSYQPYDISYSDSEENFRDQNIGGVAVAPGHGSVLIECAKKELHATTALKKPNRFYPTRISLVFYLHKSMNARNHGAAEYEAKEEERRKLKEEKKLEEMLKARQIEDSLNSARLLPGMPDQTIRYQNSMGQYAMMPNHAALWNPASVSHSMRTSTPPHVQNNIRMVSPAPYHNIIDKSRQENMDQARFKLREHLTMASQDNAKRHFANQMQGTSPRPHLSEPTSLQMSHANAMLSPKMQQQYLSTSRERMTPEGYKWPNSMISQHRLAPPEVKGMHLYNQQGIDAMRQKHLTASQSSNYPRTSPMMDPSTIHSETRNQGSSHIAPNVFDNRVNYMRSSAYHGYQMQNPHLVQQQYMMRQETHRFPIAPDQGINRQSPMYAHMPNQTFSNAPPPYQVDQSRRSLSNTSHGYGASPYGTLPGAYNPPVTQ